MKVLQGSTHIPFFFNTPPLAANKNVYLFIYGANGVDLDITQSGYTYVAGSENVRMSVMGDFTNVSTGIKTVEARTDTGRILAHCKITVFSLT